MNTDRMNSRITFQKSSDGIEWEDFLSCYAYINGVNSNEFFIANAGYEAALTVTISCRYQPLLMRITPMQYRIVCNSVVYELLSPADDVRFEHREVIFRAKRIYMEEDGR